MTTVNLTMLNGGVQYNVVPDKLQVGFDMRVTPLYDLDVFDKQIHAWCKEAAGDDYEVILISIYASLGINQFRSAGCSASRART